MKNLLLTMALFVCAAQIHAQSEWDDSYFGIKGGFNYSTNTFKDPSLTDMEASYRPGFAGGIYYNIGFSSKFAVQTELLYSPMGSKLKSTTSEEASESTLTLDYFSLPFLFKFIPIPKLGVFIGPQVDFLIGTQLEAEENVPSIKGVDNAITAGLEYWITNNIGVYGRYIYGFQNINDKNPGITFNSTDIKGDMQNSGIQVGITIGFKVKKETPVLTMPAPVAPVSKDSDGDGVMDKDDKCPDKAGTAKYAGCPVPDTDGDGVNDETDKCPAIAGTAKYAGCPVPDTDGDGVNDETDKCPNAVGVASNYGCPDLVVYFQREEAGLTDDDKANLDNVVRFLNNNPGINVIVEGHTSTPGGDAFNQTLSEKRAAEAVDYIVSKGIDKNRMQAIGLGEKFPIGDNTTEEGKAKSRRVVIKIAK
ncbi:MAG: OmpA family protein [Bacteroidia bacterium]